MYSDPETACPNCGLATNEWISRHGEGYERDGVSYCCRACAEGVGCACRRLVLLHERRSRYRQKVRL
jgi:hypothetical protein